MTTKQPKPILEIDPDKVRVFISRERDEEAFREVKTSIKERGQVQPGQVRDIRHLSARQRRREDGGLYDYELVTGQGRLLAARSLGTKFRATVEDEPELKVVGMFMAENLIRDPLPAFELGKLLKLELESGASVKQAAKQMHISETYADRLLAIVNKTAQGLEDDVAKMSVADAEAFTSLPAGHQSIVLGVLKETDPRQVKALVRKAKEAAGETGGELNERDLKRKLQGVEDELTALRQSIKLTRLHHSLGPQNLSLLLADPKTAKALKADGINTAKFEAISKE